MTTTRNRPGRSLDTTPDKQFGKKKIKDNGDGTVDYEYTFNDEHGDRQKEIRTESKTKRRGRKMDTTPGKEFAKRKIKDNDDDTAVYEIPYNDKNGVRKTKTVTLPVGKRGGHRKADATPNRVVSGILSQRVSVDGEPVNDLIQTVPFNNEEGIREEAFVLLTVENGKLVATVVDEKPEVHLRNKKSLDETFEEEE